MISKLCWQMRHWTLWTCALFLAVTAAHASQREGDDLLSLVSEAKSHFTPITTERFSEARQQASSALEATESAIGSMDPYHQKRWRELLKIDRLSDELSKPTPDLALLESVVSDLQQGYEGLENPAFLGLRKALARFVACVKRQTGIYDAKTYVAKLDELEQLLDTEELSGVSLRRVSEIDSWLVDAEQATDVTDELRLRYGNPNVRLRLGNLGGRALFTTSKLTPVSEFVAGSQVLGQTFAQASAGLLFVPNAETADVRIHLQGIADTNSTAYQRRIEVSSMMRTFLEGWKRIGFNGDDFLVWPAEANCTSTSTICSVSAPPIIRRIAYRRAEEMQPEVRAMASQRANAEITQELDDKVNRLLGEANQFFHRKVHEPLLRMGFEHFFSGSSTTSDELRASFLIAHDGELAAPVPAMEIGRASDLQLDLHESVLANTMELFLGGIKVTGHDLSRVLKLFSGSTPEELEGSDAQDWYVVFAERDPFLVEFGTDDHLGIETRLEKIARVSGDQEESAANVRVRAEYILDRAANGLALRRVGEVGLQTSEKLPAEYARFVERKVNALFGEQIPIHFAVSEQLGQSAPLELAQLLTSRGWLHVGLALKLGR